MEALNHSRSRSSSPSRSHSSRSSANSHRSHGSAAAGSRHASREKSEGIYAKKAKEIVKAGIDNVYIAKDSFIDRIYQEADHLLNELTNEIYVSQIYLGNAYYHEKRKASSFSTVKRIEVFSKLSLSLMGQYLPKILAMAAPINVAADCIFHSRDSRLNYIGLLGSALIVGAAASEHVPKVMAPAVVLNMLAQIYFQSNLLTLRGLGFGVAACALGGALSGCAASYQGWLDEKEVDATENLKKEKVKKHIEEAVQATDTKIALSKPEPVQDDVPAKPV